MIQSHEDCKDFCPVCEVLCSNGLDQEEKKNSLDYMERMDKKGTKRKHCKAFEYAKRLVEKAKCAIWSLVATKPLKIEVMVSLTQLISLALCRAMNKHPLKLEDASTPSVLLDIVEARFSWAALDFEECMKTRRFHQSEESKISFGNICYNSDKSGRYTKTAKYKKQKQQFLAAMREVIGKIGSGYKATLTAPDCRDQFTAARFINDLNATMVFVQSFME